MSQLAELGRRVSLTEGKSDLSKLTPPPREKDRASCQILNARCSLDNYAFMVSR